MSRRISRPVLFGLPLVMLLGGGALGWFTDIGRSVRGGDGPGEPLPAVFDAVAPHDPLSDAPNPLGSDQSLVIGAGVYSEGASAVDVPGAAELEIPILVGATSPTAVDPRTLKPFEAPPVEATPLDNATVMAQAPAAATPPQLAIVRELPDSEAGNTPSTLQVSEPFAAASGYASLCDEVEAGNIPDSNVNPWVRPTLAVLVNQPSTMAISGTWADGAPLEKTTMLTLPAHDDEWQRSFTDAGEQRLIIGCLTLPIDEVRTHALDGVAQLRATVLAISADGQASTNAIVTFNIAAATNESFFVDPVVVTGRGEQRQSDGVLYPTMHVHYAFLSDAVVPTGSTLLPGEVRVVGDHAFIEGADCAGWAENHQGIDRTHGSHFAVASEIRRVAGRDRVVTVVDGDVYLDPSLPGGWQGSLCVRLQATDQEGGQRATLALRGAQVRSPRTATYAVGVSADQPVEVTWTSASGHGCAATTLTSGAGAQCAFSARWVPDGIVVRITRDNASALVRVPVNTGYCNRDDSLDPTDGCNTGFTKTLALPLGEVVQVTFHVTRTAAPGTLWDDPSNDWSVGPIA